mmetsp:Transcript_13732/g.14294  ORF Transcript_13732/g.14294 Transcript_13732/m.14294 type:complete len:240 (+) Transcript_13732:1281-2000(+)
MSRVTKSDPNDWAKKRKEAMDRAKQLREERKHGIGEVDENHTFKPQINKRPQYLKKEEPVENVPYRDPNDVFEKPLPGGKGQYQYDLSSEQPLSSTPQPLSSYVKQNNNQNNNSKCFSLGFNSNNLQCQTCDNLLKVTGDKVLFEECKECCNSQEDEQFELIVLEVDKKLLKRFENIESVVKSSEDLNIILRHKYMSLPTLLMYKERTDDEPTEVIAISSWTSDVLIDYIKSHHISFQK